MVNSITTTAVNYLRSLGISCSELGVAKNINEWSKNKTPLLELLRKHPMWREDELAIVTTITEKRELDSNYFSFCDEMRALIFENSDVSYNIITKLRKHIFDNHGGNVPDEFRMFFSMNNNNDTALRFVTQHCFSETVDGDIVSIINLIAPEFKFKSGQK